jgi:cytochrome c oxidase assembly factor CtaG
MIRGGRGTVRRGPDRWGDATAQVDVVVVAAGGRTLTGVPYAAIAPLTGSSAATAWTFDPVVAALVVVLAGAYLLGVRRVTRPGCEGAGRWPIWRTVFFLVFGLGTWVLETMWFLGAYDTTLFWPRAAQTVLMLMVTPLFLALGMPVTLLMRAVGPASAARLRRIGHSRFAQVLTFPAVISIALLTTPFALFFTPWFDAMLRGGVADTATHLWLIGVGWAYYWTRLQIDPVPRVYPALVSMWITFAEVIFDGGLGLILIFGHHVIGLEHYQAVRDWGPSPRADQQAGGTAFWILGDLSGLPFLGALFRKMISDDERKSVEIDRELDAAEAAARAAAVVAPRTADAPVGEDVDDGMQRPWWETDPSRLRR